MRTSFKNKGIIIGIAILILAGGIFYFYGGKSEEINLVDTLPELRVSNPEWGEFIDKIEEWETKVAEDPERNQSYLSLGMAWKSLGDRSNDMLHYKEALKAFEVGNSKTVGGSSLYLVNAGNMAKTLKDYPLAEEYYKKAIEAAPGDVDIYIRLADFYKYQLKKDKSFIIEFLEGSKDRLIAVGPIEQYINVLNKEME